jgi:predicted nucleic acid-binding protein
MPKLVYDTRFFAEYFYSADNAFLEKAKDLITKNKDRYVSALTVHEIYLLSLKKEGREAARVRLQVLLDSFRIVDVNAEIAVAAAELRNRRQIPMADGVIVATCKSLEARCVTDDPHFTALKEIKTLWF